MDVTSTPRLPEKCAGQRFLPAESVAFGHMSAAAPLRRDMAAGRTGLHALRKILGHAPAPLRIATLVVASCCLGILIAGTMTAQIGRSAIQRELGSQTEQVAVLVTRALDSGLAMVRADLARLDGQPWLQNAADLDRTAIRTALARFQADHREVGWIVFLRTDGTVEASAGGPAESSTVLGQEWFRPFLPRAYLANGRSASQAGAQLPTLVQPVTDASGQVAGLLAARMNEAWLEQAVGLYLPLLMPRPSSQAHITVADGTGMTLSGPDRGRPALDGVRRDLTLRNGRGWFRMEDGPGADIVGYAVTRAGQDGTARHGAGAAWIVVAHRADPVTPVLADAAALVMLLSAVAVSVVGITLSVGVGSTITAPVGRLAEAAMRIGRGLHASEIGSNPGDRTVARLAHALRSLVRRVDSMQAQLRDAETTADAASVHQAQQIETLHRLAVTDPMTGLLNRRGLALAVEELLAAQPGSSPLGVLLIDVDHFKQVNDRHGHTAGDNVIRAVAATIASTVRQADVVARLGGEEFVAVLPNTGIDALHALGDRIRLAVSDLQTAVPDGLIHVTMCAGAAVMRAGEPTIQDAINRADAALYRAKAAGRNRVFTAEIA